MAYTAGGGGGGYTQMDSSAYGGGGDGGKRRDSKGVFPVTIAEILRNFNTGEDKLVVGDNEVSDVTFIAQIVSIKPSSTKIMFVLDDKSGGNIEANYWLDGEQDRSDMLPAERSYIRVFGKVKAFGGRMQLNMFTWKLVDDVDMISEHIFHTIYAHHMALNPAQVPQQLTGVASQFQNRAAGNATVRAGGGNSFGAGAGGNNISYHGNQGGNDGFGGGGDAVSYGAGLSSLPAIQQDVYRVLFNDKSGTGCAKDSLKRQLTPRYKPNLIEEALSLLQADGYVYPTIDDNHYAALS